MTTLMLHSLPDLTQLQPLFQVAPLLWERPDVVAIWIGGSIARGNADGYSDVDLRITVKAEALEEWKSLDLNALFAGTCVAHLLLPFGEQAFLHHLVLATGAIYDMWVQSAEQEVHDDTILVLACRDAEFARRLTERRWEPVPPPVPASGEAVRELLVNFWINSHKHRKVLHRGLHLLTMTGIHTERQMLLRLWHIQATGCDYGEMRTQGIHGLTQLMRTVEQARGAQCMAILGASLASRADICAAIAQLRDEVRRAGHALAQTLRFDYPEELEQTVRRGWLEFLDVEAM